MIAPTVQAKLLRVLQEREFEPLGSERTVKVDVRVIAATNRDLRQLVAEGKFQEDLFYRLNVIPIAMPPLRDRREDIPLLVDHFIRRHASAPASASTASHRTRWRCSSSAPWPGNVRELENTIERAVVLTPAAGHSAARIVIVVGAAHAGIHGPAVPQCSSRTSSGPSARPCAARSKRARGIKKDAAEAMGISQRALSYYLAKHRIETPDD